MQTLTEKLQKANKKIAELTEKSMWKSLTSEIVYRKVRNGCRNDYYGWSN